MNVSSNHCKVSVCSHLPCVRLFVPLLLFAVLVLKVVICPLAALGLVKLLTHIQTPYAEKLPVAPLASVIEMGIKFASKAS